jgi:hypothetical protein
MFFYRLPLGLCLFGGLYLVSSVDSIWYMPYHHLTVFFCSFANFTRPTNGCTEHSHYLIVVLFLSVSLLSVCSFCLRLRFMVFLFIVRLSTLIMVMAA